MSLKYYKSLDGLRGLAALMVMWFHFMPDGASPVVHFLHKTAIFGQTGVTLFFVLSGFLITRILLHQKSRPHYFRNFYIRRALRIFPLYYLFLAIYYFVGPLIIPIGPDVLHRSWMYWIYLQNFSDTFNWKANGPQHFWSLAVEEHFYLFWPLVVYFFGNKGLFRAVGLIIILALLSRLILIKSGYGTFYLTFAVMDGMAIGALLALLEYAGWLAKINFGLVFAVSLLLLLPVWLFAGGKGFGWIQLVKFPVIAVFYASVIGLIIDKEKGLSRLFQSLPMRFIGKISYGLYVFHPFFYPVFYHYWATSSLFINAAGCFLLSFVAATLSFYLFEQHFVKLKKYFEYGAWRQQQARQFN